MKRKITVAIIAAATLALSAGTMNVFATEPARGQGMAVPEWHGACGRILTSLESDWTCGYCGSTCHFLDEDGDGLCDYHAHRDGYQYNAAQGYNDGGQQTAGGYDSQQIADDYGSQQANDDYVSQQTADGYDSQQTAGGYGYQGGYDNYGQGGYGGYCDNYGNYCDNYGNYCDNYGNYCDNYDGYGYCGGRGGNGHHGGYGNGGGHHGR